MGRIALRGWYLAALGAVVFLGCGGGDDREPVYQVTGTVTRNGTALEGAVVTFTPVQKGQKGKPATGVTDASGKYSLGTWAKDDGAQAGQYQVTITKYDTPAGSTAPATSAPEVDFSNLVTEEEYPAGYDEMAAGAQEPSKNTLPAKYADPNTSGFQAEVVDDESKNVFDFSIEG